MTTAIDATEISSPAYLEGRRAGKLTLSPALNPFPDTDPRSADWNAGWHRSHSDAMRYANSMIQRDKVQPKWTRDGSTGARDNKSYYGRAA